jgi:EAL and modified HD-GYP domain-containing signal transduction protein
MSLLRLIFGHRPAPPPPPPPPAAPPAPRGDTLVLAGLDLAGAGEVTITVGERTFAARAEYGLQHVREVVPEPAPATVPVRAMPGGWHVVPEPAPDPNEIAVVRRPIADADGAVVGYELVVDGHGAAATAGLLLDAFGDIGLERLTGRHPAWVPMTPEFLLQIGTPPVRPDRVVLQIASAPASAELLTALGRLKFSGYTLALDGSDEALLDVCSLVKVPVAGRTDDELRAAVAEPLRRGLGLVATGVATPEEVVRCRALGFTSFQGDFFAKPDLTRSRRVGTGGVASLRALAAVTAPDATFEDLEQAIAADIGLSLKLLRYVNSAFFALPRNVESVREALTLLGTGTVRRWAVVMALVSAADDAPDELVELALQRARMCEVLGGNRAVDASDAHFTVGLFSVADALLALPMEDVLETLPFSDEIRAALLRREGPKGELLSTVVAYESGEFPAPDTGEVSLAGAYGDALQWAGGALRAAA